MRDTANGRVLDRRYSLVRLLGRGAFGTVWLAEDLAAFPPRRVALKLLRSSIEPRSLRRFRTEAEVLLAIDHPNIVRAFDLVIRANLAYIVMEYVGGATLHATLAQRAREGQGLTLSEIRGVFAPICLAVEAAHAAGVLHRDLKPANVILSGPFERAAVKVVDFGMAKLLSSAIDEATTHGRLLGSLLYMSPEQARARRLSVRSDVFALGSVLFELLTLRRAWARDARGEPVRGFDEIPERGNSPPELLARIASGERGPPSEWRPGLPVGLDVVTLTALAQDPAHRQPSVAALLEDFLEAVRGDWPLPLGATAVSLDLAGSARPEPAPEAAQESAPPELPSQEATPARRAARSRPANRLVLGWFLLALTLGALFGGWVARGFGS